MITGVRTALICDRLEQDELGRTNAMGLYGDTIYASSRPGFVDCWLLVMPELDGRPTEATVMVEAPEFAHTFPYSAGAGLTVSGAGYQMILPVLQPGRLTVTVRNAQHKGAPFTRLWKLAFTDQAAILGPADVRELMVGANKASGLLGQAFTGAARLA